jgi:hypothetical protein
MRPALTVRPVVAASTVSVAVALAAALPPPAVDASAYFPVMVTCTDAAPAGTAPATRLTVPVPSALVLTVATAVLLLDQLRVLGATGTTVWPPPA